jgi:hypothetical protein
MVLESFTHSLASLVGRTAPSQAGIIGKLHLLSKYHNINLSLIDDLSPATIIL